MTANGMNSLCKAALPGSQVVVVPNAQVLDPAQAWLLPHARAVCSAAACFRFLRRCVRAIALRECSNAARRGACSVRAAATRFAAVGAMSSAELSPTEAIAARMSCLLCRGLFSCDPTVFVRERDTWVQQRCSVGRMMCVQLPLGLQVWRRWQLPN